MANYVKISKSKNLRFRLVSILYLLFITLTLLQIPVDWLRVNARISTDFMNVTSADKISDIQLANAIKQIENLQTEFNSVNLIQKDPTGYKATDEFFIYKKKGAQLFAILHELEVYFQQRSPSDPIRIKFQDLFKDDLKNGLETGQFKNWMDWKFKNVPGSVAQLLINELLVRCHLLHGSLGFVKNEKSNLVQMAFNLDQLHLGDQARLVINSNYTEEFKIFYSNKSSNDYTKMGDSIIFTPTRPGKYELIAIGKDKSEEKLEINVLPMTISGATQSGSANNEIQYFFQGKPSKIVSSAITKGSKYELDGGKWTNVSIEDGRIAFTPTTAGWNVLKLQNAGVIYLADSVFVYPTPQPVVVASQVSNNKISSKQLNIDGNLKVNVFHPMYKEILYKVEEMEILLIGDGSRMLKTNSNVLKLDNSQISKVRFIQVKKLKLSTTAGSMELKEPLLIEVI